MQNVLGNRTCFISADLAYRKNSPSDKIFPKNHTLREAHRLSQARIGLREMSWLPGNILEAYWTLESEAKGSSCIKNMKKHFKKYISFFGVFFKKILLTLNLNRQYVVRYCRRLQLVGYSRFALARPDCANTRNKNSSIVVIVLDTLTISGARYSDSLLNEFSISHLYNYTIL